MATPYKDRDPSKASTPEKRFKIIQAKLQARYEDVHARKPDDLTMELLRNLATLLIAAGELRATLIRSIADGCSQEWSRQFNATVDKITKLDSFLFGASVNPSTSGSESDWSEMVDDGTK